MFVFNLSCKKEISFATISRQNNSSLFSLYHPFPHELKKISLSLLMLLMVASVSLSAQISTNLPKRIYVENNEKSSHVQGVAVDIKRGYAYFSFTTKLIKTDLQGRVVGSVTGLTCHLGCIDLDTETGKLYASIEYKDDEIGRGILNQMGR